MLKREGRTEKGLLSGWSSVLRICRARIPWLLLLMLSASLVGRIIGQFEATLAEKAILVTYLPMLMGTGGNCGNQATASFICQHALGRIRQREGLNLLWTELKVGMLCGLGLAVVCAVKILLLDRHLLGLSDADAALALTVSAALLVTVVTAKLLGVLLPLLISRLGADPAVVSGPLVSTAVDAAALVTYLSLARRLFGL